MQIDIGGKLTGQDDDGFIVNGLRLESSRWEGELKFSPELSSPLPPSVLRWIRGEPTGNNLISIPVYLNNARKKLLYAVKVSGGKVSSNIWYQRGVALTAWNKE